MRLGSEIPRLYSNQAGCIQGIRSPKSTREVVTAVEHCVHQTEGEEGIVGRKNPKTTANIKISEVVRVVAHPDQNGRNQVAGNHEKQVDPNPPGPCNSHKGWVSKDVMRKYRKRGQGAKAVDLWNSLHFYDRASGLWSMIVSTAECEPGRVLATGSCALSF